MHASLAIEELGLIGMRHDRTVPHVRMQVQAAAPVTPEAHERLGRDVIAGQRQRYDEALAVQRIEQLAAVGVIVGPPDKRPLARLADAFGRRLFRPVTPAKKIAVPDAAWLRA